MDDHEKAHAYDSLLDLLASLAMAIVAVFGLAWVLGVIHVPASFGERVGAAVVLVFVAVFVISEGTEWAIGRCFQSVQAEESAPEVAEAKE